MKLLITICDRNITKKIISIIKEEKIYYQMTCYGEGTANSEILSYFGLANTEKEVIFTICEDSAIANIFANLKKEDHFTHAGAVAFTIAIDSIGKKTFEFIEQNAEVKYE